MFRISSKTIAVLFSIALCTTVLDRYHRSKMNSWSFHELKRQIEYKSAWAGIQVIQLSKKETRGTSTLCPVCGKRLQEEKTSRNLWCNTCQRWNDRDVIAAMNQSLRGWTRFAHSKGDASEAMVQESGALPVILRVDASKLQGDRNHSIRNRTIF